MNTKSLYLMMCATILALLMTACSPVNKVTTTVSAPLSPAPASGELTPTALTNGLVDLGGRKLMIHCTGQGNPTVILEAGGPDDSSVWFKVQSGSDRSYRVCSYDRANLGSSDPAPAPRTFVDMARDLSALLMNARIDGPYILVGHSMGGMLVRVFADQYPEKVAGLVLVDAAHPDMGPRLLAGLPQESLFESKAIRSWRKYLTWMSDSNGQDQMNIEGVNFLISNEQVKTIQSLGDLPLVVISRSPNNTEWPSMPTLPKETNSALFQIWQDMQRELAGLSSNTTHVIASHAGHMIPTEEPELIIGVINKLVKTWREQMGVTISADLLADQTEAAHPPRILRVVERQETQKGDLVIYKDIYFTDEAGDAAFVTGRLVSADPPGDWAFSFDNFVTVSADEQKREALLPGSITCVQQATFVIEKWIIDQAGNQSEPFRYTYACPAPQLRSSPMLIIGISAGLGLLVMATWLLVRTVNHRRRGQRVTAVPI